MTQGALSSKKLAAPKKRGRGRSRKNVHGREEASVVRLPPALDHLDFKKIRKRLSDLVIAVPRLIERDKENLALRNITGLREVLEFQSRTAGVLHRAVLYLIADENEQEQRGREYLIAAAPLNRSLLDIVFNLAFIFQHPASRAPWFLKAGWRSLVEEHELYRRAFGRDPAFRDFIRNQRKLVDAVAESLAKPTPEERKRPRKIERWPNPGRLVRYPTNTAELARFLEFADTWFYGDLSSAAHSTLPELMNHAGFLKALEDDDAIRELATKKMRSVAAFRAIALVLAVFSEIEIGLELGRAGRLSELWMEVSRQNEIASLYRARYETKLTDVLARSVARGKIT